MGGWKRKGGGRIPETAVDEEGKEHTGQDALKVWRDSFFQLGVENLEDRDFDRSFARDVERKVSEYEREEEKGQEESEKLNEDITQGSQ